MDNEELINKRANFKKKNLSLQAKSLNGHTNCESGVHSDFLERVSPPRAKLSVAQSKSRSPQPASHRELQLLSQPEPTQCRALDAARARRAALALDLDEVSAESDARARHKTVGLRQ